MAEQTEINEIIESVVKERFADRTIVSVHVKRDSDYEGDPVFLVQVVFGDGEKLDANRASGLTRHVRSELTAAGETAFPLFSFISRSDFGKLNPEAA